MAFYWHWSKSSIGTGTIPEVYTAIATNPTSGLPSLGYTGIEASTDVHGSKGKFLIAVLLLPIAGSECWQVVGCSGEGSSADAKSDINSVVNTIGILLEDYF